MGAGAAASATGSSVAGSGLAAFATGSSVLGGSSAAGGGAGAAGSPVFFLRFSFGRLLGADADEDEPHVAPPPTGVFEGALYAGCSAFCFSRIASAAARSGKRFSSSVSTFRWVDILEPHPIEDKLPPPARAREDTHFPPLPAAAAAPNRLDVSCSSFFSFSSLMRWASRSMPSLAAANFAFVSCTRNFSAMSSCSLPPVCVLRERAFVSTTKSLVVTPAGTTTLAPLRVLATSASSSHCESSFPASVCKGNAPVVGTTSVFDNAGAST
mmetsp:Transcript_25879/g.57011  ORF Transcript_25879/g.57011 Transcript_25879/m.57011 type:complete len:269 (+) Transcript_25879:330-1136(+)